MNAAKLPPSSPDPDLAPMRLALRLARRAYSQTSPNPLVGAVIVRDGKIIGRGWHHRAGQPHAEIEALRNAAAAGHDPAGATLYVTLEPCCTQGRTPPCTAAITAARLGRVVVAATDPNPHHRGRAFEFLRQAGIAVTEGVLATEATRMNESFNHWIVTRTPFVTVKAAQTLDGKIATASGESQWITGSLARAEGMKLRTGSDAILLGINTVLADDPSLTVRSARATTAKRRIILDSRARTPLNAKVVADEFTAATTIVVGPKAPARRVAALQRRVAVWTAPESASGLDLSWLLAKLGGESVTSLLVEGGGEVNAAFLTGGFAHRVALFFAPKILGGRTARKSVAGDGLATPLRLTDVQYRWRGMDLLLTGRPA